MALSALGSSGGLSLSGGGIVFIALTLPAYVPFLLAEYTKFSTVGYVFSVLIEIVYLWLVSGVVLHLLRKVFRKS